MKAPVEEWLKSATGREAVLWFLALIPYFVLTAWMWDAGPGLRMGDYGHLLAHARALAEGRSYADTGYIFTELNPFISPRLQPPVVPALLALTFELFGGYNPTVVKLLMFLTAMPFLVLAGRYFLGAAGPTVGIAVTLLLGVAPVIAHWSLQVNTDLGFCAMVWIFLWFLDREEGLTVRHGVVLFLFGSLTMAYRTAGVALVPTVILYAVINYKRLGRVVLIPGAAWITIGTIVVSVGGLWGGVLRQLPPTPGAWFARLKGRLVVYASDLAYDSSAWYPRSWDGFHDIYHLLLLAIALVGLVEWLRRSWRSAAASFAVCYAVMLGTVSAAEHRYLWPLYPIIIFFALNGLALVMRGLQHVVGPAAERRVVTGASLVVAVLATVTTLRAERPVGVFDAPDVVELVAYLQGEPTPPEPRVVFFKTREMIWHANIATMGLVVAPPEQILAELAARHITHVIVGDLGLKPRFTASLLTAIDSRRCLFEESFRNDNFVVYRVRQSCPTGGV